MKRPDECPDCGGSGRHATIVARHPEHRLADGTLVHEAYEGPAQCDRCAGKGKIGAGHVDRRIHVPHDHPRAAEIRRLLSEQAAEGK